MCGQWYNHRGRWYYLLLSKVADVIAIIIFMADGKPTSLHVAIDILVDVIAKVADGIVNPGGYNKHLADVIATSGRWNSYWVRYLF